jgi:predicted dehydrogenase
MNSFNIHVSRRSFFRTSAAVAAGATLPDWFVEESRSYAAAPQPISPNDKPGIALVGCGGQGRGDCNWARNYGNVIAVCDVDESHTAQAAKEFTRNGKGPIQYKDFRKVMERDDVHVVINGTPDHWHTFVNIAACKAGKDIYTEKPLTLTIDEGKRLVKAVRERRVILQVGSQQRSDPQFRLACELVRNGRIGKLQHMLVGLPTGPRQGPFKPIPIPAGFDWDFYLGQAQQMDYLGQEETVKTPDGKTEVRYRSRCSHWDFRWWYCFSGGQMTDWGAHHNDIAQWGNGTERSGPVEIDGKSLVDMVPGGFDAAAEYEIRFKYANGVAMTVTNRAPNGVKFEGAEGWIFVTRGQIKASKDELLEEPLPAGAIRLYKSDNHMGNFFECIRSRKEPICDVEIGHRSITVAHLGVISVRMKQPLKWNPDKEEFAGENAKEANGWLAREQRKPYTYDSIA